MTWEAIPARHPGSRIGRTEFRFIARDARGDAAILRTLPNTKGYTVRFRHHDNRVWVGEIDPIYSVELNELLDGEFDYSVSMMSPGCRTFQFAARSLSRAKDMARRFANISQVKYERLTADAQGTVDHPRSDDIGVFRMFVTKYEARAFNRQEVVHRQVSGIGRLNGDALTMFPSSEELEEIFVNVCPVGVVALIPPGINQIGSSDGATFNNGNLRASLPAPPEFDPEVIHTVLNRNFNDSFVDVRESVSSGEFTPRRREAREINFGDDDDAD